MSNAINPSDLIRIKDHYKKKEFVKAFRLLHKLSLKGLPWAQNNLGAFLERGLGVPADERSAIRYYRSAAYGGNFVAKQNLWILYSKIYPENPEKIYSLIVEVEQEAIEKELETLRPGEGPSKRILISGKLDWSWPPEFIDQLIEEKIITEESQINEQVEYEIIKRRKATQDFIVFVSGHAGTGKRKLCQEIQKRFKLVNSIVLAHDWYLNMSNSDRSDLLLKSMKKKNSQKFEKELSVKNWYSNDLFKKDLKKLLKYRYIERKKLWNYETGELDKNIKIDLGDQKSIILVHGDYLQEGSLLDIANLVVFIGSSNLIFDHHKRLSKPETNAQTDNTPGSILEHKPFVDKIWLTDCSYFTEQEKNADISFKLPEKEIS